LSLTSEGICFRIGRIAFGGAHEEVHALVLKSLDVLSWVP
jgi:hypothetical protein